MIVMMVTMMAANMTGNRLKPDTNGGVW